MELATTIKISDLPDNASSYQKKQFILTATINGRFDLIIQLSERNFLNINLPLNICDIAAQYGHLNILRWFYCKYKMPLVYDAISAHADPCYHPESFSDEEDDLIESFNVCNTCAENGYLDILIWVLDISYYGASDEEFQDLYNKDSICYAACKGNQLKIVIWIHEYDSCLIHNNLCIYAASFGNIEILEWAISHEYPLSSHVAANLAGNGQFEALKWVFSLGCPLNEWDSEKYTYTINGSTFTCSMTARMDGWTCSRAARDGHLDILQWLREQGCPFAKDICKYAAMSDNLDILKWLQSLGCSWDEEVCATAAEYGHLKTLIWLREQGCQWNKKTTRVAASNGMFHTFKWAVEHDCPVKHDLLHRVLLAMSQANTSLYQQDDFNDELNQKIMLYFRSLMYQ